MNSDNARFNSIAVPSGSGFSNCVVAASTMWSSPSASFR
jgi:hypothetical protein